MPAPSLLLQHLLCPGLPHNANPANTSTPYNPYITVDFIQNTLPAAANANDWRQFNATAKVANYGTYTRVSMGRTKKPYTGATAQIKQQLPAPAPPAPAVQHTFFQQNAYLSLVLNPPADWLVHFQRHC